MKSCLGMVRVFNSPDTGHKVPGEDWPLQAYLSCRLVPAGLAPAGTGTRFERPP